MAFQQRAIMTGWFCGLALTVAATFWKRALDARRRALADEEALARLDSDLG